MSRLPIPGEDDNVWGQILNNFLEVSLNGDGTLQSSAVEQAGAITSVNGKSPTNGGVTLTASDVSAPTTLAGDGDVSISSPSSGQVLTYDASSSQWVNRVAPSALVSSVFGRTGAVTAQTGDYTANQVGALPSTDDLSAIATQNPTQNNVSLNSHKITNLTNGSAASDAAAFGQVPTAGSGITNTAGSWSVAYGTSSSTAAAGNDSRIVNAADSQTSLAFPSSSGVIALDCSQGYVWHGTVTGNFTFNLINLPASGTVVEVMVKVVEDSIGGHTFGGWQVAGSPITPTYDSGVAPNVSTAANVTTFLNILTIDGGLTLNAQGQVAVIDGTASDIQAVGQASGVPTPTGLAADSGHTHQGVTQIINGGNLTISGGDGNGHGVLTVAAGSVGGGFGIDNMLGPADQGLVAWSYPPILATTSSAPTSGVIYLTKVALSIADTVTNVILWLVTAGSTLTSGENLCGLYSLSGTILTLQGQTADQSTAWSTSGNNATARIMPLTSAYSAPAGYYYIAVLAVGTTMPIFARISTPAGGGAQVNVGATSIANYWMAQWGSSETSLPSTIGTSWGTNSTNSWCGLS